jgi:starch phosphorylase
MDTNTKKPLVAYFCMEYGLDNSFKTFSGGLGILAGDLIKAARDAEYPMVAVGILWRQGYTSQTIDSNNHPVDAYPEYSYDFLKDTGVEVEVGVKEYAVRCKVWLCDCFGNIPLYLLDAYLPNNPESLITGQLYGWFAEERLEQEIILGVGGVRALEALGVKPDIYHFNEGHAALAGLELIRKEMEAQDAAAAGHGAAAAAESAAGAPGGEGGKAPRRPARAARFKKAWAEVRKKIVFTTHTPVMAGNEAHRHSAMFYTGANNGFSEAELNKLGGDPFNMTVAGLHLSRLANAVSELHADTANKMWAHVKSPAKIIAVTNGVHNGTWQDLDIARAAGEGGSGDELWALHRQAKERLIAEIGARNGVSFDPDRLLIGFARRAAPYKRSDLIFRDVDKISPLLESGKLQLVFSGKAHPNDMVGKGIVSNLNAVAKKYPGSVAFLQNYDMEIGKLLTRGCDVWLNNPIKPLEASGTSGMKAAMNGVLNFSVLDGWWPEGCAHGENGWQIGGGYEGDDCDSVDAESLYGVLTGEIIPTFYDDREKWIAMMRSSIAMSQGKFSAARMLGDYVDKMYCKLNP